MKKNPTLSIITCTYNCVDRIGKTIASVNAQSFTGYEYIILDGNSTDGTKDFVQERYSQGQLDCFLSEEDQGLCYALNRAIELCGGKVIVILHAGTRLEPDALQNLYEISLQHGFEKIIAGSVVFDNGLSRKIQYRSEIDPLSSFNTKILHESLFVPKSIYEKLGLFDCNYVISTDYEWICRAERFGYLPPVYTDHVMIRYDGGFGFTGAPENELRKITEHFKIGALYAGGFFALRRYLFRILKIIRKNHTYHRSS